ncbi:MAG: hypothetical protein R3C28_11775 [Pirellulaceae bacterium]
MLANNFANSKADFFLAAKWIYFTLRGDSNRFELLFGRFKQLVSSVTRCSASRRIATDNQSLVGKCSDVTSARSCVEQRHLDRAGYAQLANFSVRKAEIQSNPSRPRRSSLIRADDHAAITNENEPVDAETFTSRRDDLSECRRVGRLPGKTSIAIGRPSGSHSKLYTI